jgi:hypothetical protein
VAGGGAVAVLLRIGEDYGRLRFYFPSDGRGYWRDVLESLRYVALAVLFLAALALAYVGALRLFWGDRA